jgi:hypothetical protein
MSDLEAGDYELILRAYDLSGNYVDAIIEFYVETAQTSSNQSLSIIPVQLSILTLIIIHSINRKKLLRE